MTSHHISNTMVTNTSALQTRLAKNLRTRISIALTGIRHRDTLQTLLGCTIPQLITHLEQHFTQDQGWHNYSRSGWHIDHVIGCINWDLTDEVQRRCCFHFTNTRPTWSRINLRRPKKSWANLNQGFLPQLQHQKRRSGK